MYMPYIAMVSFISSIVIHKIAMYVLLANTHQASSGKVISRLFQHHQLRAYTCFFLVNDFVLHML